MAHRRRLGVLVATASAASALALAALAAGCLQSERAGGGALGGLQRQVALLELEAVPDAGRLQLLG